MKDQSYSNYRWVIGVLLFLGLLGLNVLWFIPSPLLTPIMKELDMSLMQGGLGMSVVCLLVAVFGLIGGSLVARIGIKRCFLYGLIFMAAGALLTLLVKSFTQLFLSRILIGIGFGLCLPVSGAVIMMWFPEPERPYINTINSTLPYVATAITFVLTIPLYLTLNNSWRLTIGLWGGLLTVVAVIWMIWGKASPNAPVDNGELPLDIDKNENLLLAVWRNREVRLLSLAEGADMWAFQFLTSMLPTYYTMEVGMPIATASNITAIFPLVGIGAGLICGVWMSRVGLRKPFTWPMHLATFIGTILAINAGGWLRLLGVALAGFGNAGWAPALFTMPMEFEGSNPSRVGAIYAVMLSLGFLAAFISPWLGGWLAQNIGLHDTIFIFSFSSLLAALCTILMRETGISSKSKTLV